jgi:hypothetical protein
MTRVRALPALGIQLRPGHDLSHHCNLSVLALAVQPCCLHSLACSLPAASITMQQCSAAICSPITPASQWAGAQLQMYVCPINMPSSQHAGRHGRHSRHRFSTVNCAPHTLQHTPAPRRHCTSQPPAPTPAQARRWATCHCRLQLATPRHVYTPCSPVPVEAPALKHLLNLLRCPPSPRPPPCCQALLPMRVPTCHTSACQQRPPPPPRSRHGLRCCSTLYLLLDEQRGQRQH